MQKSSLVDNWLCPKYTSTTFYRNIYEWLLLEIKAPDRLFISVMKVMKSHFIKTNFISKIHFWQREYIFEMFPKDSLLMVTTDISQYINRALWSLKIVAKCQMCVRYA